MPRVSNININVHLNKKFEGTLSFPIQTFADRSSIANSEVGPARLAINNHKFGTDNSKQAKKGSKKEDAKNSVALLPGSYCITKGGQLTSEAQSAQSTKSNSEHQSLNSTRLTSKHRNVDLIPVPSLSLNSSLNQSLSNVSAPKSRKEKFERQFNKRWEKLLESRKSQAPKMSTPLAKTDRKSNLTTRDFFGKDSTRKDFGSSLSTVKAKDEESSDRTIFSGCFIRTENLDQKVPLAKIPSVLIGDIDAPHVMDKMLLLDVQINEKRYQIGVPVKIYSTKLNPYVEVVNADFLD